MKYGIVFDWDGTLVSCEEKIDTATGRLCQMFPEIAEKYHLAISENRQSPGWTRRGFIASLPEDCFTYRFGIIAELIAAAQSLTADATWPIILHAFKESYLQTRAKVLVDQQKLRELSNYATLHVVSNSGIDNITFEADSLGFERSIFSFIGDAKKYGVEGMEPSIIGISAVRPKYRRLLNTIKMKHEKLIVIGDNFCLDLVTPISMGVRTAYVPNPLSSNEIQQYVKDSRILSDTINNVIETLIQEVKEL